MRPIRTTMSSLKGGVTTPLSPPIWFSDDWPGPGAAVGASISILELGEGGCCCGVGLSRFVFSGTSGMVMTESDGVVDDAGLSIFVLGAKQGGLRLVMRA